MNFLDMKLINYHFWIVKVLKMINNRLITVLNRMDRLKHRIGIIFGRYLCNGRVFRVFLVGGVWLYSIILILFSILLHLSLVQNVLYFPNLIWQK